jgi:hypothetical protein
VRAVREGTNIKTHKKNLDLEPAGSPNNNNNNSKQKVACCEKAVSLTLLINTGTIQSLTGINGRWIGLAPHRFLSSTTTKTKNKSNIRLQIHGNWKESCHPNTNLTWRAFFLEQSQAGHRKCLGASLIGKNEAVIT